MIDKVDDILLEGMEGEILAVSTRLLDRAIKIAGASSLISYFKSSEDNIKITDTEIRYAIKFYIEEMNVRLGERFKTENILKQLGI